MALELSGEQRSKVIKQIERLIAEKGNCRVGWAIREIAGPEFERSIHNKEKIANTMIGSGRYSKEKSAQAENDWNIFVNPEYKRIQFNRWTVIIGLIVGIVSAIATVMTIWRK